jgi:uncharacterized protein (TIGR03000 family)
METTMCRTLAILTCCLCLLSPVRGQETIFPDSGPARNLGGLMIIRRGDQTTTSLGGVLFPRKVTVTTATPEGPIVTRFTLPSVFQSPDRPPLPGSASCFITVELPDPDGMLYFEGKLIRTQGTSRLFESPILPPGEGCSVHLCAVFKVGTRLLIEDKQVLIRAGEASAIQFDGSRAVSVSLEQKAPELILSAPSRKE